MKAIVYILDNRKNIIEKIKGSLKGNTFYKDRSLIELLLFKEKEKIENINLDFCVYHNNIVYIYMKKVNDTYLQIPFFENNNNDNIVNYATTIRQSDLIIEGLLNPSRLFEIMTLMLLIIGSIWIIIYFYITSSTIQGLQNLEKNITIPMEKQIQTNTYLINQLSKEINQSNNLYNLTLNVLRGLR